MRAIILAAGEGSRLRPLTKAVPKALLPVGGGPIIEKIIELLIGSGLQEFVVVIGHLGEKIKYYLGDGSSRGIKINYLYQDERLGSGDALSRAQNRVDGNFLVTACDTLFLREEITVMLSAFDPQKFDVLVGLREFSPKDIGRMSARSTVKVDKYGFVQQIIEKPEPGKELSNTSAAPIFLFTPKIWPYLDSLEVSGNDKYELASAIQNLISDGLKVKGHLLSYSRDITYPEDILKENFPYLRPYL